MVYQTNKIVFKLKWFRQRPCLALGPVGYPRPLCGRGEVCSRSPWKDRCSALSLSLSLLLQVFVVGHGCSSLPPSSFVPFSSSVAELCCVGKASLPPSDEQLDRPLAKPPEQNRTSLCRPALECCRQKALFWMFW